MYPGHAAPCQSKQMISLTLMSDDCAAIWTAVAAVFHDRCRCEMRSLKAFFTTAGQSRVSSQLLSRSLPRPAVTLFLVQHPPTPCGAAISASSHRLRASPRGAAAWYETPEVQQQAALPAPSPKEAKGSARTPGALTPSQHSGSSSFSVQKRRGLPGRAPVGSPVLT